MAFSTFNKVVLEIRGSNVPPIYIYNDTVFVGQVIPDRLTGAYQTTTDDFQQVADAIRDGVAVEIYRFGTLEYGDGDLPSWLDYARDNNPFHKYRQSQQQLTADPVTRNRIRFKNIPAPADNSDVVFPTPNLNYASETLADIGLLADGWYSNKALPTALGDPADTIVVSMETTEKTSPIIVNGQITGYGFTIVSNGVTPADTKRYSSDGVNWVADRFAEADRFATLQGDGTWQEYALELGDDASATDSSGRIRVGTAWAATQTHIVRSFGLSQIPRSNIDTYEIEVRIWSGWPPDGHIIGGGLIVIPRRLTPLLTPHDFNIQIDDTDGHDTWRARISKTEADVKQGIARDDSEVQDGWNEWSFGQVSFPVLAVYADNQNYPGNTAIAVNSASGLAEGDILFMTSEDGTTEQMRFVSTVNDFFLQPDGTASSIIEVERGVNGTTILGLSQLHTATGHAIVDEPDVLRFLSFRANSGNEHPVEMTLFYRPSGG